MLLISYLHGENKEAERYNFSFQIVFKNVCFWIILHDTDSRLTKICEENFNHRRGINEERIFDMTLRESIDTNVITRSQMFDMFRNQTFRGSSVG